MKARIWLLGLLAIIVAGLIALYLYRVEAATAMLRRAADSGLAASLQADLPDGLHVAFCGTGSPLPDRSRAGPCTAVIAGTHLFVFDAGEGSSETLSLMGISPGGIDTLFLTHLHSDHFDGLAAMARQHWANASAQSQLRGVGPEGAARVAAGLNEAYAIDSAYRTAHHGDQIMPPTGAGIAATDFVFPPEADQLVVHDADGARIIAFRVNHPPVGGAVGYRIEYGGRSVVISGDTTQSDSLVAAAQGADLLVHEALSTELSGIMQNAAIGAGRENIGVIFHDILDYHSSPEVAGQAAQDAGVGSLALTHLIPTTPIPALDQMFVRGARSTYSGPVWAMRDGDIISLPVSGGLNRSHSMR